MKFVYKELYDAMQSIVSRCWLDVAGHGLPPPFTPVLAACDVGNNRSVYAAMVDDSGVWHFPEFQGDEMDIEVLLWMPRPEISMRFDTAFSLNTDMLEAVTAPGINKMAGLHAALTAATQRSAELEASLKEAQEEICRLRRDWVAAVSRGAQRNAAMNLAAEAIRRAAAQMPDPATQITSTVDRLTAERDELAATLERAYQEQQRILDAAHESINAATARAEAAEAKLAAVPVSALRRWFEHSTVGGEVAAMRYERDAAGFDESVIRYWLNGNEDDGVPPAAAWLARQGQGEEAHP